MKNSHIAIGILFVVIVCILAGLTYWYVSTPKDARNSDAAASLSSEEKGVFTDLSGNEVSFDEHVGRIRVVTSWASWNPFSITDLETLNAVAGSYKDKGVVFLAINRKESKEQAERFLKSLQELPNLEFAIDTKDTFYTSIGGYAMPETVLYDEKGGIAAHKRGTFTEDELKALIEAALLTE
jgi:thiol-disulfide isomerase/thioredoxin